MKKTAAMLMAIWILALMLTACGQQAPEQTGGSVKPGAEQDQSVTGQVDASQPDEEELEMGSVNGGTYTNNFAGIGCALDETWVFYTKEQIAELNGFLTDGTNDEDMKKLMDYYLPMTVKLLNAYADMDRQPVQGETIRKSKQEIDATLDTLNAAFEKLLDSIFKATALDVSSDITVLNTLLAQEGLTDDELTRLRKKQESNKADTDEE